MVGKNIIGQYYSLGPGQQPQARSLKIYGTLKEIQLFSMEDAGEVQVGLDIQDYVLSVT